MKSMTRLCDELDRLGTEVVILSPMKLAPSWDMIRDPAKMKVRDEANKNRSLYAEALKGLF